MRKKKKTFKGIEYEFDKRSIPAIIVFVLFILLGVSTYFYWRSKRNFEDNSGMIVTTTIFPIFDIASNISKGSDNFIIYQIITNEDNPLDYNPTISDEDLIKESDIIFQLSPDYDNWINNYAQKKTPVVDLSSNIELRGYDGSLISINYQSVCEKNGGTWLEEYDECENLDREACYENDGEYSDCASSCRHETDTEICVQVCVELCDFSNSGANDASYSQEGNNPYYFFSIQNAKKISERIYIELTNICPGDQDLLYQNYLDYINQLDDTDKYIKDVIYNWDINDIYLIGDYFDYFANDYGISINRISQASIAEYNEHNKNELEKLVDNYNIDVIYIEINIESEVLQEVSNTGKIKIVELDLFGRSESADTYINLLKYNVKQIVGSDN